MKIRNIEKFSASVAVMSLACASFAASYNFNFSSSTGGEAVDFWTAVSNSGEYGSFSMNNPYSVYCDNGTVNAGGNDVNLILSGKGFSEGYPLRVPGGAVNLSLNGANLAVVGEGASLVLGAPGSTEGGLGYLSLAGGSALEVADGAVSRSEQLLMNGGSASSLSISGKSTFYNRNTKIGSASSAGENRVTISGSGNDVTFRNMNFIGGDGTSAASPSGGILEFVADASGISTVSHISAIQAFSGVVVADFSALEWDAAWGSERTFVLISSTGSGNLFKTWCDSQDSLGSIIGASGSFSSDGSSLSVTISQVPEPASIAAAFALLAAMCALSARRR